jgi:site-specific DNA-methyltransferase (adenine-specific)
MRIDEATFKAMPPELRALFVKLPNPGSEEVVGLFPQTGISRGGNSKQINAGTGRYNWNTGADKATPDGMDPGYGDSGSAARFFYCAKTSKKERGEGNNHPTVKPIALMTYLCRLVTPPGGIVLDPFMGSGSTGIAALQEGFDFIGIERDPEYLAIAEARIAKTLQALATCQTEPC